MAQRRGKLGAPILSQIVRVLELAPYNLTAADALLWGSRLNWAVPRLTALGQAITENAAGRSITDWLNIANHLPDREADVTVFARTPTWAADRLAALAQLFAAQAGGRSAADWVAIAAPLRDQEANVAIFARTPAWAVARLAALAQLFATEAGGRSAADWAAIAAPLRDQEANVAIFARTPAWAEVRLAALAQLFATEAGGRSAADWVAIAAPLRDQEANVATFARTPAWAAARLAALAQLFATDAGGRSAADWAAIAAPLRDQEANVATFARTPNWAVADLVSLAQNRANYAQLRQLIMPLAVPVKTSALGNQALLTFLNASLPWDDFAKTVELLGRQIPDYATLVTNPTVRGQLQQAWVDSQPGQNPPLVNQHEEGGWIYLNIISGALTAIRQVAGGTAEIDLSAPPVLPRSVVVAKFHTHPNLGGDWEPGPSQGDQNVDPAHGVPDIVVAQPMLVVQYYLSGPPARLHLAGNQGLPGLTGGTAP
ncbi:MAG: hypothetical protein ACJ8DI_13870 [Ktedonobacteraceae bacterium]